MREIVIQPALNGYICRVGCQTVVFETAEKLTEQLLSYLKKPKDTEKSYIQNAVNPMEAARPQPPHEVQESPVYQIASTGDDTAPPPTLRPSKAVYQERR